jgi:hypothetical protein
MFSIFMYAFGVERKPRNSFLERLFLAKGTNVASLGGCSIEVSQD